MENEELSKAAKQDYLSRSVSKHQDTFRECMNGEGVDRHLFALYVACKGSNMVSTLPLFFLKSLFIDYKLSRIWYDCEGNLVLNKPREIQIF